MKSFQDLSNARKTCRECMCGRPGAKPAKTRLWNGMECGPDPDVVSYWSQWLGHHNPKLLIVGQDFSNVEYFCKHGGRDHRSSPTNENLWNLLTKAANIAVGRPPDYDPKSPVFLTNSILCLKDGPMDAPVLDRWIDTCADKHLSQLKRILQPAIVVGMGRGGWRAVRRIFKLDAPEAVTKVAGESWITEDGTRVFAVAHCGPKGRIGRPLPLQESDWRRIGQAFAALPTG